MAHASPVPSPRSPLDGRWRAAAAIGGALVVALVLKPWGAESTSEPVRPTAAPTPFRTPLVVARAAPASLLWDPAALGPDPPGPEWAVLADGRRTPTPFVDPGTDPVYRPDPGSSNSPIVAGPVVELGTTDRLTAFALAHPTDQHLGAVRLWRFEDAGAPERVELRELGDPWNVEHVRVFGIHTRALPDGTLAPWRAGLYRLDLLVEPAGRIRTVLLTVRTGDGAEPGTAEAKGRPVLDERLLRRLPSTAGRWAFGQLLVGWADRSNNPACRVAEIWRAADVDDPCHPTPVGRPTAIGVNLGVDRPVTRLDVHAVDPLPGPVEVRVAVEVNERPGLAMAHALEPRFADGIYRVEATTDRDVVRWYVEVGPDPLE